MFREKDNYGEEYWFQKHPCMPQVYRGRPLPTPLAEGEDRPNCLMDVRHFVWQRDAMLQHVLATHKLVKETADETALAVQKWIVNNMQYVGDDEALSAPEFWLFPAETVTLRHGDCEDGALLMASLLLTALPESEHWRVRVAAGLVQAAPSAPSGGHMWVTYFRKTDNQPVILDWCYLEDSGTKVKDKPRHDENTYVREIWFSTNHKHTWAHRSFDLAGRIRSRAGK